MKKYLLFISLLLPAALDAMQDGDCLSPEVQALAREVELKVAANGQCLEDLAVQSAELAFLTAGSKDHAWDLLSIPVKEIKPVSYFVNDKCESYEAELEVGDMLNACKFLSGKIVCERTRQGVRMLVSDNYYRILKLLYEQQQKNKK